MSGKQCQRGVQEEVRGGNITEEWEEAILRLDGSAAPWGLGGGGGWGAGKGGNVTVPEVGADVLPGNPGSYHSAGAKDWGHSLHCPPRKLLPRPCRLSCRDLPLWIWKLACMFPPLLAEHGYFPGAKGRQEVPCFLPPELVPVSVREHILGIPAFCGLY